MGGPRGGFGPGGGYGPGMHGGYGPGYGGFGGPMGGFGHMWMHHRPRDLRARRDGDSYSSGDSNLGIMDKIIDFKFYMDDAKWSHHTLKLIKDKNAKMTLGTKFQGVLTGSRAFILGKFRRMNFSIKSRAVDDQYLAGKINKDSWMRKQRNIAYEYFNWLWKIKYFPTRYDVVCAMNEWGSKVPLPLPKEKKGDEQKYDYVAIPYVDYMNKEDQEENERRVGRSR